MILSDLVVYTCKGNVNGSAFSVFGRRQLAKIVHQSKSQTSTSVIGQPHSMNEEEREERERERGRQERAW